MKKYKYGAYALCFCSLLSLNSCFDLEEEPFSEIIEETYVPTEEDEVALLATAYSPLRFVMDWYGYFDLQEEAGDVIVVPTRPTGWDDGGVYKKMHMHTWTNQQGQPQTTWSYCFQGISNANKILMRSGEGFIVPEHKSAIENEVRALRALWYSMLCDTHGNVPIQTSFSSEIPKQSTRKDVFDFIVKELEAVIPGLSDKVDKSTYGRMNQWGARCLLARMYLNAEVYTGVPMWKECLEQCDLIIKSKKFDLEYNYKDVFKTNNENSKEIIFAIPYDEVYNMGTNNGPVFGAHMKWLANEARDVYNLQTTPWNGSAANPQFINSYDRKDQRLYDTWLQGEQKNAEGKVIMAYANKIPSLYESEAHDGYRVGKYEIKSNANSALSNDFPYFRYAEVLLMKAEALLRMGQDEGEAVKLVNRIRERAFRDSDPVNKGQIDLNFLKGDTHIQYGTLDTEGNIDNPGDQTPVELGGLYDEWGWEFAAEARRRIDMIRFGTFQTKSWFNHTPQGEHVILFPIHLDDLNANMNLEQNPGYPGRG